MFSNLSPKNACEWIEKEVVRCSLMLGEVMFIPVGYVPWIIGLSDEPSFCVCVPILSKPLIEAASKKKAIKKAVYDGVSVDAEDAHWQEIGSKLQLWLS